MKNRRGSHINTELKCLTFNHSVILLIHLNWRFLVWHMDSEHPLYASPYHISWETCYEEVLLHSYIKLKKKRKKITHERISECMARWPKQDRTQGCNYYFEVQWRRRGASVQGRISWNSPKCSVPLMGWKPGTAKPGKCHWWDLALGQQAISVSQKVL